MAAGFKIISESHPAPMTADPEFSQYTSIAGFLTLAIVKPETDMNHKKFNR